MEPHEMETRHASSADVADSVAPGTPLGHQVCLEPIPDVLVEVVVRSCPIPSSWHKAGVEIQHF